MIDMAGKGSHSDRSLKLKKKHEVFQEPLMEVRRAIEM